MLDNNFLLSTFFIIIDNWKKNAQPEGWVMFYLVDKTEALSPEHGISDNSERQFRKGKWGAKIYRSFCNKDQVDGTF